MSEVLPSGLVLALEDLEGRPEVLRVDGVRWSGVELDALARSHAAGLLALGVGPGDRVAVTAETSVRYVAATLAHLRLGIVHVPVNPRYGEAELRHVLEDSGARCHLREEDLLRLSVTEPIEAWPGIPDEGALALLIYTSGTTGRPKGVMLSHRALASNLGAVTRLWGFGPTDTMVLALPLFHVHGLGLGLLGGLMNAVRLRLHRRFEAAAVIEEFRAGATVFMGVPTMYHLLLEHLSQHAADGAVLGRARLFSAGSAALSEEAFGAFERATGHRILERYGMTETGFITSNAYAPANQRRPGCVGRPLEGVRVRLVDEAGRVFEMGPDVREAGDGDADAPLGEIEVQTTGLMEGYWGAPEATATAMRDGWFRTGDTGTFEAGQLRIVGRTSTDILKSAGYKIGAGEIEDVLSASGLLREVAVVGLADPKWGEVVTAVIVPREGLDEATLIARLEAHCAGLLVDYKRPRRYVVVESLPRNALGKVQKASLKQRLSG